MKHIGVFVCFVSFFAFSSHASDGDLKDRKGFFLGVGVGPSYEAKEIKRFGFAGPFKIGAGINDQLMLHYTGTSMFTYRTYTTTGTYKLNYFIGDALFSATFFFIPDGSSPYVTAGVGAAIFLIDYPTNLNLAGTEDDSKGGFALAAGGGYEWRIGRTFAIQAEMTLHMNRVKSTPWMIILYPAANFLWYF